MAALEEKAAHVPPIQWAQRKDALFLTVNVPDVTNEKIDLTPTALSFAGDSDETRYAFSLEFFSKVVPEESVWKVHGRNVLVHVVKAEASDEHWPRLTNDKKFDKQYVTTDWSRYVDEDEEDEDAGFDVGDLDGAANFGGPVDADDAYEPDSDDDVDLGDLDFPPNKTPGAEGDAEGWTADAPGGEEEEDDDAAGTVEDDDKEEQGEEEEPGAADADAGEQEAEEQPKGDAAEGAPAP